MSDKKWRLCGSCKKTIDLGSKYFACGIASCRKSAYCSLSCFDDHSPIFRHKDAWAEEKKAPLVAEPEAQALPKRIDTARLAPGANVASDIPHDVLVVASKLKDYIKAKSGMSTSANVLDRLSDMIRIHCNKAMERATSDNRKTVMDRDFHL